MLKICENKCTVQINLFSFVCLKLLHCLQQLFHRQRYQDVQCVAIHSANSKAEEATNKTDFAHIQVQWECVAETGTIYDDVFTGSTRRRHGLTWAGAWDQDWCHVTLTRSAKYSIRTQQQAGVRVSGHWTGVADDTTWYDEHSGSFCTHSLAHHWCNCCPLVPTPGSQCAAEGATDDVH